MTQETPFQDPFELLKKMWAPMGLPLGTLAPLLDPNDIEKRIATSSRETWLSMNMNVRADDPGTGDAKGYARRIPVDAAQS
jgi:hypothetical protein